LADAGRETCTWGRRFGCGAHANRFDFDSSHGGSARATERHGAFILSRSRVHRHGMQAMLLLSGRSLQRVPPGKRLRGASWSSRFLRAKNQSRNGPHGRLVVVRRLHMRLPRAEGAFKSTAPATGPGAFAISLGIAFDPAAQSLVAGSGLDQAFGA
jgi:hypothetical protein